jgi:hypothetical protein
VASKKRIRTVRSAELKEFEREVSLEKMYLWTAQRVRFFSNNQKSELCRASSFSVRSAIFTEKSELFAFSSVVYLGFSSSAGIKLSLNGLNGLINAIILFHSALGLHG